MTVCYSQIGVQYLYSLKLSDILFGSETVLSFIVNDCVMLDLSLILPIIELIVFHVL